ncbi:unnamed protein product [Rodentolepis nana]|uniref:Uncharacterized protein n=1 Tax=Rodentolepis nana TaxID=102285 RepID=A0A0R3TIE6_RODNA|nr:unnamed protein product [Rodentolepis nana]
MATFHWLGTRLVSHILLKCKFRMNTIFARRKKFRMNTIFARRLSCLSQH